MVYRFRVKNRCIWAACPFCAYENALFSCYTASYLFNHCTKLQWLAKPGVQSSSQSLHGMPLHLSCVTECMYYPASSNYKWTRNPPSFSNSCSLDRTIHTCVYDLKQSKIASSRFAHSYLSFSCFTKSTDRKGSIGFQKVAEHSKSRIIWIFVRLPSSFDGKVSSAIWAWQQ